MSVHYLYRTTAKTLRFGAGEISFHQISGMDPQVPAKKLHVGKWNRIQFLCNGISTPPCNPTLPPEI
jgi:hypothetical protein